jgi:hypothetical protein
MPAPHPGKKEDSRQGEDECQAVPAGADADRRQGERPQKLDGAHRAEW